MMGSEKKRPNILIFSKIFSISVYHVPIDFAGSILKSSTFSSSVY